ncbi:MAG TPA: CHRD domain-containing protein [Gaiellaceae bacterium]|nr:CHRD domain-containing protein [Gaiellaceae bacterium]
MRKAVVVIALVAIVVPAVALGGGAKGKGKELKASLVGSVEVPKGSPTGKGTAEVYVRSATRVCWEFTYSGIGKAVAAHIHKGKPGKAGPVVVPFGAAFKREGCTTAPAATVRAILASPAGYYVNVHTAKYPAGAIRGQLKLDT